MIREKDGRDFTTFAACQWLRDYEIDYKHRTWQRGRAAFALEDWPRLLASPGEICGRVVSAMRLAANLVPLRYGDVSFRGWTGTDGELRRQLELLTLRLMTSGESRDEAMEHLDGLCRFLMDHHLPCQWQPLSYLLFLCDSERYFPVHPGQFQKLLEALGVPVRVYGRVTGEGMSTLLEVADVLRDDLAGYAPRDLIDVHSYMWVVARRLPPPGARVLTVGYGGRAPSDFVALLKANRIATIADVRLHPDRAMMEAYSKAKTADKGIEKLLRDAGIGYAWLQDLGNPYMGAENWADRYRELMASSGEERTASLLISSMPSGPPAPRITTLFHIYSPLLSSRPARRRLVKGPANPEFCLRSGYRS